MGDDQAFDEGIAGDDEIAVGGETGGGERTGFLPAVVIKILKWAALAVAAIIFIVTVVVITMSIMNKGAATGGYPTLSEPYQGAPPVLAWYNNIGEIQGRTADENPTTVIVDVSLGYSEGDKALQAELISRTPRMRDLIRQFFGTKTSKELRPVNEDVIKEELRTKINTILKHGQVQEVIFQNFNVVEF